MTQSGCIHTKNTYEIVVHDHIDESWLTWFDASVKKEECMRGQTTTTTLTGIRMDQAGLVGLIRRLHGVGVVLISVRKMDQDALVE